MTADEAGQGKESQMTATKHDFSKWEKVRKQGCTRFVLVHGAIGWGLLTAVLYSLLMWLISDADISRLLPIALVLFPIGGLFWGAMMWWFMERKYKQQVAAGGT